MPCRSRVLAPRYSGDDRPPAHRARSLLRTAFSVQEGRGLLPVAEPRCRWGMIAGPDVGYNVSGLVAWARGLG